MPSFGNVLMNCFIKYTFMYRDGNIIFFMTTSGLCRMFETRGLRSELVDQFLFTKCFSRGLLSLQAQKIGLLGASTLLKKKEAYCFKVSTGDQVLLVILQYHNDSLYVVIFFTNTECSTEIAPCKLTLWRRTHFKINFDLSMNSCHLDEFPIPLVNYVCYGNIQTYCHFENTSEIHFLWIENKIPSFLFQARFSHVTLSSVAFFDISQISCRIIQLMLIEYLTIWVIFNLKICIIAVTEFIIIVHIFKRM